MLDLASHIRKVARNTLSNSNKMPGTLPAEASMEL